MAVACLKSFTDRRLSGGAGNVDAKKTASGIDWQALASYWLKADGNPGTGAPDESSSGIR